jgi:hypothetical protein
VAGVDVLVVAFAPDVVVVVLVAADLLDELHAPRRATHTRNTTAVLQPRRTPDPTDMNSSSVTYCDRLIRVQDRAAIGQVSR